MQLRSRCVSAGDPQGSPHPALTMKPGLHVTGMDPCICLPSPQPSPCREPSWRTQGLQSRPHFTLLSAECHLLGGPSRTPFPAILSVSPFSPYQDAVPFLAWGTPAILRYPSVICLVLSPQDVSSLTARACGFKAPSPGPPTSAGRRRPETIYWISSSRRDKLK